MALRNMFYDGDEILRKKAREVEEINERMITILDDMIDTMRDYDGVGIAAPQIGILRQIIVVEIDENYVEFFNPKLIESLGGQDGEEGCLSVPGMIGTVERPEYVKVKGLNRYGEEVEVEARDYFARVLCHEIDHLNGVLFTDIASEVREAISEEED